MEGVIKLVHGDGGEHTKRLIQDVFYRYFENDLLLNGQDAVVLPRHEEKLAFTTDSFVVKPLFFSGGNIGKLSVCGTINDLVVSGAEPLYLSVGFIIEEGFKLQSLEEIVKSMGEECRTYGVRIVTGDTKVVEKGSMDGVFINTAGIGKVLKDYHIKTVEPGDNIIISGSIGEHGTTIAVERYGLKVRGDIKSDCASLSPFLEVLKENLQDVKIIRDPTRGGLATVLHEFCGLCGLGVHLWEDKLPVREEVSAVSQILGLDPLYLACEGRMVLVVNEVHTDRILQAIHSLEQGKEAKVIGTFTAEPKNLVLIENYFGGKRRLPPLETSILPRIC